MLQNLLVIEMVAYSPISDRRKWCMYFLSMMFPSQLSMLSSFDEYALSWGFHLLVVSRYNSYESVMSPDDGLEIGKYEKNPHNWRGIVSPVYWKYIEWSSTVGFSTWILGVSNNIIPASRIIKGGVRFLSWRWCARHSGLLICRSSFCGGIRIVLLRPLLEYFSSYIQVRRHWILIRYLSQRVWSSSGQLL